MVFFFFLYERQAARTNKILNGGERKKTFWREIEKVIINIIKIILKTHLFYVRNNRFRNLLRGFEHLKLSYVRHCIPERRNNHITTCHQMSGDNVRNTRFVSFYRTSRRGTVQRPTASRPSCCPAWPSHTSYTGVRAHATWHIAVNGSRGVLAVTGPVIDEPRWDAKDTPASADGQESVRAVPLGLLQHARRTDDEDDDATATRRNGHAHGRHRPRHWVTARHTGSNRNHHHTAVAATMERNRLPEPRL